MWYELRKLIINEYFLLVYFIWIILNLCAQALLQAATSHMMEATSVVNVFLDIMALDASHVLQDSLADQKYLVS